MLFNSCMNNFVKDTATKQISYSEFMEMAKDGKVKAISIDEAGSQIFIYPSDEDTNRGLIQAYYTGIVSSDTSLAEKMEEYGVDVNSEIPTPDFFNYEYVIILGHSVITGFLVPVSLVPQGSKEHGAHGWYGRPWRHGKKPCQGICG